MISLKKNLWVKITVFLLLILTMSFSVHSEEISISPETAAFSELDLQTNDRIGDGIIVSSDEEYCGCCHSHQHDSDNFFAKISCFFCRFKSFFTGLFGRKENNAEHKYKIISYLSPSCTHDGKLVLKCAVCSASYTQDYDKTDHSLEPIPAVAPTCIETGLTEGSRCGMCGEVFVEQETVPALGHSPVLDPAIEPTCDTNGLTEGSHCSVCGEILIKQESIPALGHTFTWEYDGDIHTGTCSVCGGVESHIGDYEEIETPYTGTIDGCATFKCKYCDHTYTEDYVAKAGNTLYTSLEAALQAANSGDKVILLKDYTMTRDAEVKSGVLLLIPCMDNDIGYTSSGYNPDGTTTANYTKEDVLYRTLTIADGAEITVNGTMLINAVTGRKVAGSYTTYDITGGYALVNLDGDIVVNSSGVLDCSGRVEGDGQVTLKSGATMYETYSIVRWRGGSYSKNHTFDNKRVYPIYESEMNTMRTALRIESGASLYGTVKVYTSEYDLGFIVIPASYNYHRFLIIGSGSTTGSANGLYRLHDGAYCIRTVEWDDSLNTKFNTTITPGGYRDVYKFFGGMSFCASSLMLNIGGFNLTLLSDRCGYFTVDGDARYEFYDGEYNLLRKFEFLPGFQMYAGNGAVINVQSTGGLLFADSGFYTSDSKFTNVGRYPSGRAGAYLQLSDGAVLNVASGGEIAGKVIYSPDCTININSSAKTSVSTNVPTSASAYEVYTAVYQPILN